MKALCKWILLASLQPATLLAESPGPSPPISLHTAGPTFERTEARAPCRDYTSLRRPYFGDTHVHTAWSFDAAAHGTRNTPTEAYAFARGGSMSTPPYTADGSGGRVIQLDRPLDFAAVTDHA